MPGDTVKNRPMYEELIKKGFSKANAARMANASVKRARGRKKRAIQKRKAT